MTKRFLAGAFAAVLLAATPPANAAPEDDYVALMTAVEIDKVCVALKYVESDAARSVAFNYLMQTGQWAHLQDGRMDQESYYAWEGALKQKARDAAAAVGCTDAALPAILTAKAKAAEKLFQGLVLAFFFDSFKDDIYHQPLDDYAKQAASGYDTYLQQLYGESFQGFVAYNHEQARLKIPQPMLDAQAAGQDTVGDLYDPLSFMMLDDAEMEKAMNAQSDARYAVTQVQFEVTAEVNNFIVRPRTVLEDWVVPELRRMMQTEGEGLTVVHGPSYNVVDITPDNSDDFEDSWFDLQWVVALRPDGGLRVMFYGGTAAVVTAPVVTLYVPTEPLPEGKFAWDSFGDENYRDRTVAYTPVAVTESCLGGPCFDFPPEVTDALLTLGSDNVAELHMVPVAGAGDPVGFRQGRFPVDFLWKIRKGTVDSYL